MAKVLYISLDGVTESIGESQIIQYLLELSKQNSICLFSFEKPADKEKFSPMKKRLHQANIQWKYLKYSNRFGICSTLAQITFAFFLLANLIRKEKIQIIHARSLMPAFIAMLLKQIFNIKVLFDIRGFLIDEKIMWGRLKEPSFLTRLLKKMELAVYKNSAHIVALTHASKPIIEQKFHVKPENISVIPTCANQDLFKTIDLAKKLALKEMMGFTKQDIVILRNGSLNGSYDLDAEFVLFQQLMQHNANIKFLFLNKGQHGIIDSYLDRYNIDKNRCKILAVDFAHVSNYINLADISVFFIKPSFAKQASAPTKFAEMVACHLYSVTNTRYGDMEYYFNSHKVGMLFDLDEVKTKPNKAAEKVIEFLSNARNDQNNSQDFEQLFKKYFSKQVAVERYQWIYSQLT